MRWCHRARASPEPSDPSSVVITRFHATHASHDTAQDGSVSIDVEVHDPEAELEVLWTTGASTYGTVLANVRPGVYGAIVVGVNGRRVTSCIVRASPARVGVRASG